MERLIAAAIKFNMPDVSKYTYMTGIRHADILHDMYTLGIVYNKRTAVQGFMTNYGRFVDRYEAKEIAIAANQLIIPIEETYAELFSEDVW